MKKLVEVYGDEEGFLLNGYCVQNAFVYHFIGTPSPEVYKFFECIDKKRSLDKCFEHGQKSMEKLEKACAKQQSNKFGKYVHKKIVKKVRLFGMTKTLCENETEKFENGVIYLTSASEEDIQDLNRSLSSLKYLTL